MTRAILTPAEMQAAEAEAVAAGTPSYTLMERAGAGVAEAVQRHAPDGPVQVLCGPGGNGGDGFVAARCLAEAGRTVSLYLLGPCASLSGDTARAAEAWSGPVHPLEDALAAPAPVIVDALFGGGLSRPLDGTPAALAQRGRDFVVAVDVPSGLDGLRGCADGPCFRADVTVSFAALRPAHLLEPGAECCGLVEIVDIGVEVPARVRENGPGLWDAAFPVPARGAHKHARGHLICVTGGPSSTGAARLGARAGLRIGAGLVTLLSPRAAVLVNAIHSTAVMVERFDGPETLAAAAGRAQAELIGPAAGVDQATRDNLLALLATPARAVIDADALTVFRDDPDALFARLRRDDVLTPHPGEFARLFGDLLETSANRIEAGVMAAARAGSVVLLKGADTVIAAPDGRVAVNTHSAPWLATAGSGDVLAGLVGGLAAQGMASFEAAAASAWLHGEAGRRGGPGLIAEDLPEALPAILAGRPWANGPAMLASGAQAD